jgi:branched-chain amino acid transport system substrate-binding protein
MERGATALPEVSDGAEIGVERVNTFENGINGHPIELVKCATDGTPESSAGCANQFVAARVAAVVSGSDLGTDAMVPILRDAGIALLGSNTLGIAQTVNNDAFFFAPPATSYPRAEIDLAKLVSATKVAMVLADVSQVPIVTNLVQEQAKLNGIEVSVIKFDPAAPDFAAVLAAVNADGADAIATISTDDWCTGIARASLEANFQGKLILGQCTKYADEIDLSKAHGVYGLSPFWSPRVQASAPPEASTVLDQFRAAMAAAGRPGDVGGILFIGYATINQVANVLRTIGGELSAASVMSGMHVLSSAPNPLGDPISCNPRPYPGTSSCATGWLQFEAVDANTAKPLSPDFVAVKG